MTYTVIILLFLLICLLMMFKNNKNKREGASFNQMSILQNPELTNEIDANNHIRIIGIEKNVKMDKNGRVEYITYAKPLPESGEVACYKITCPAWLNDVVCWKCT